MPINSKDHPDLWAAKVRRFDRRLAERRATQPDLPPIDRPSPPEEPQHQQALEPSQSRPRLRLVE